MGLGSVSQVKVNFLGSHCVGLHFAIPGEDSSDFRDMDVDRDELNGETFKWTPDRFAESEPKNGLFLTFQMKTLKDHKTIIIKRRMKANSIKIKKSQD